MSATATHRSDQAREESTAVLREGLPFRLLALGVSTLAIGFLTLGLSQSAGEGLSLDLLGWAVLVAVSSLVPLPTGRGAVLSMDLPVLLGAAIVFGPIHSGVIAFLGAMDAREWKRQISPSMAIYNRAQISLSVMFASTVFHRMGGELGKWPWAAVAGLAALAADSLVNYSLVAFATEVRRSWTFRQSLSFMTFGEPRVFIPTYLSFGFLGVLLAEAFVNLGFFGVVAFIGPVLVARQLFLHRAEIEVLLRSWTARGVALEHADQRIVDERRDERLVLAGEIHDEVLPPLFKVHLMGQVLKQDLGSGRLLDLDDDLPELLQAVNSAQEAIRTVLGRLRRSQLGPDGLVQTIRLFSRTLEERSTARIHVELQDVGGDKQSQFVIYQVVREALTNAVEHAAAKSIRVRLWREAEWARLVVEDDGMGFEPLTVDRSSHFGLQLLVERVEAIGGSIAIESRFGRGTSVVAAVPL